MMKDKQNDERGRYRPLIILMYAVLIIAIALLLFKKFHVKKNVIDLNYGEEPTQLLHLVREIFSPNEMSKISLIFIFNDLPALADIESINKLSHKHGGNGEFFVIFHKKFKTGSLLKFPHRFISNANIECHYLGNKYVYNYFLLLDGNMVRHVDNSINPTNIHFLIERHMHPEKDYMDYALSKDQLREKIIEKLDKGNINLLNISDNTWKRIDSFGKFNRIYVIISSCTSCELKAMVADFKLRQILDEENELIIFPVYADGYQLSEIIEQENLNFPLYLDWDDGLDLFSLIPNPRDHFIIIEARDINNNEANL